MGVEKDLPNTEEVTDEVLEVLEEVSETTVEEETQDVDNTNTDVNKTQEEVQEETFDPETMFEENEELYIVGDYDFSKYKDTIDFENPKAVEELETAAKKYKENGFTQEQIEFMLEERIQEADEKENDDVPTLENIKEKLNKTLSVEEKRNYKSINSFVNDTFKGTELEGYTKGIMGNPMLVKMMNIAYKGSLRKTGSINQSVPRKTEKAIHSMSTEEAYNIIDDAMSTGKDVKKVIKEIKGRVTDQKGLQEILNVIGIK